MATQAAMDASAFTEFQKLSKDIRTAVRTLDRREARYLVDTYYQMQEYRISSDNQARSMGRDGEPHETISFFGDQMRALENQIKTVLKDWVETEPSRLGEWALSITGIGPVIAAGMLAHIDIHKSPTAGQIWRFAGLDPTVTWRSSEECRNLVKNAFALNQNNDIAALQSLYPKFGRSVENLLRLVNIEFETDDDGNVVSIAEPVVPGNLAKKLARRPWNANLKVICWKAGESFVKVSGNPKDYYGKIYIQRKEFEVQRNEKVKQINVYESVDTQFPLALGDEKFAYCIDGKWYTGGNAEHAWTTLQRKRIGKDTDAYKAYSIGKLPPAHIHARAKRYAVKLFIAHYHEMGRKLNGLEVPAPYPIAMLGHNDYIAPPNQDMANEN